MKHISLRRSAYSFVLGLIVSLGMTTAVTALGSQQNPQSGQTGLSGTVSAPPPTRGATITIPSNGQTFTTTPITVAGSCPNNLLVKIFSNNVFVGSVECTNGSYTLKVDLFAGENQLVARVYDALDQAGPDSNTVTVTFKDAQFDQFGTHVVLTSNFARLGVNPGSELTWPIIVSGGIGPYAVSTDWGDGTGPTLQTVLFPGAFNVTHTYRNAGVYNIVVRATDANGTSAYLQLVGVANGKVSQSTASSGGATIITKRELVLWPFLIIFPLIFSTFWLGRRYELLALRRQIERQTELYAPTEEAQDQAKADAKK